MSAAYSTFPRLPIMAVGDGEDGGEGAGEGDDAWCQVMV